MKTEWDYTSLADAYLERPDYSQGAIDAMLKVAGCEPGAPVCDVGAGVAHLTLMLAAQGCVVHAVEPNDAMRANGRRRTDAIPSVQWFEGVGEATGRPTGGYELVTFGSSFNVCDRQAALSESARLLHPNGWFACMWNHRDLTDPIQSEIEAIIRRQIPEYGYGSRRENQTNIIRQSPFFEPPIRISGDVQHRQSVESCIRAWQSHATLERQAGQSFKSIIDNIANYVLSLGTETLEIPYTTRIWMAQKSS